MYYDDYDEPTISELCGSLWRAVKLKLRLAIPFKRPTPSKAALDVNDLVQLTLKDLGGNRLRLALESFTATENMKEFFDNWKKKGEAAAETRVNTGAKTC
jgi:hypothetical protein